jgi:hypothetical protein
MMNQKIFEWAWITIIVLLWLWVASFNAWVIWRKRVRKEKDVPSMVPLVGGVFAFLLIFSLPDCQICLFRSGLERFVLFIAMSTVDFGSIPYLVSYGALPRFTNNK